jgi:hypothetical protein
MTILMPRDYKSALKIIHKTKKATLASSPWNKWSKWGSKGTSMSSFCALTFTKNQNQRADSQHNSLNY